MPEKTHDNPQDRFAVSPQYEHASLYADAAGNEGLLDQLFKREAAVRIIAAFKRGRPYSGKRVSEATFNEEKRHLKEAELDIKILKKDLGVVEPAPKITKGEADFIREKAKQHRQGP